MEDLEGFGDFKIAGHVTHTVKYAGDFVLLGTEETMVQGITERLISIGRDYGTKMSAEKTKIIRISKPPFPAQIRVNQKQLENVGYFIYLSRMITKDARCVCEIKSRTAKAQAPFNKKTFYPSKLGLNLRKKLIKQDSWSKAVFDAENRTLQKVDQKYLESLEMWC